MTWSVCPLIGDHQDQLMGDLSLHGFLPLLILGQIFLDGRAADAGHGHRHQYAVARHVQPQVPAPPAPYTREWGAKAEQDRFSEASSPRQSRISVVAVPCPSAVRTSGMSRPRNQLINNSHLDPVSDGDDKIQSAHSGHSSSRRGGGRPSEAR